MREAMGEKGPRMPLGASGFMSNVSSWLGPPNRKTNITDFARAFAEAATTRRPALWGGSNRTGRLHRPATVCGGSTRCRRDADFPEQSAWQAPLTNCRKPITTGRIRFDGVTFEGLHSPQCAVTRPAESGLEQLPDGIASGSKVRSFPLWPVRAAVSAGKLPERPCLRVRRRNNRRGREPGACGGRWCCRRLGGSSATWWTSTSPGCALELTSLATSSGSP